MDFGSLGGRFTTVEGLLQEVSGQVCGCGLVCVCRCVCVGVSVCTGVWVCLCVQVCGCVCVRRCVGVSVCRCVGVSVQVYGGVCICAVCGAIRTIYHYNYIAQTIFYSPFHSPSLFHTTSSFHAYCSSSLFIRLRLVIVHLTTQRCRDLSVSSKRWELTALNMLRVFHTSHHTHRHALGEIRSEMSPSMSP